MWSTPARGSPSCRSSHVGTPSVSPLLHLSLAALSIQHGYAIANGVNLLAANYGEPKNSHGGSGIYSADGTIADSYIDGSPSSKLVISNVTLRSRRVDKTVCPTIVSSSSGARTLSNFVVAVSICTSWIFGQHEHHQLHHKERL
jgi:hypothetical protein